MGELTPISLASGTGSGRHKVEASARLINCYKETLPNGGKNQFALYAVNGWENYATLPGASGGVRGLLSLDTELLTVAGRQLYSVSAAQEATLIGGIASDGLVSMARNRQSPNAQAVIVSDGIWYVYQDGAVTIGSDPDLLAPIYVTEKDGYFVFLAANGTFTITGIDDITVDGLDFANAQSNADGGMALATRGTDLIIFGQRSVEFWTNTGNADFPFERQAYRGYGCYAAGSVSEITAQVSNTMVDSVAWAATDEKGGYTGIYLLDGYSAQKISDYNIDRDIEDDPAPSEIRSFAWSENGHVFYTIKGSTYSHTYDTVEGVWHERKSSQYDYWRATAHATFDGKTVFGNSTSGELYRSGRDLFDADGETVSMEIWLPIVHAWPYELILNRIAVDAVTGVGLNSTDEHLANPQIMFDLSRDGGQNFGSVLSRDLGRTAQINKQLEWRGLGIIPLQGTVFRFRVSAGVKRAVMGVAIDVDRLAA
tara:strand:+ start:5529 stop:6977 length:1449 start_codon:yes stop_codon:yes gene_type:complete